MKEAFLLLHDQPKESVQFSPTDLEGRMVYSSEPHAKRRRQILLLLVASSVCVVIVVGRAVFSGLNKRLDVIEKTLIGTTSESTRCSPFLIDEDKVFSYTGCGRHVYRGSTQSRERCFDGTLHFYNVSLSRYGGLYDMELSADGLDIAWHFSCVLTGESTKRAECVLTFEKPSGVVDQGPGFITMSFQTDSSCEANAATIINSFPYDALTNNAGIYAFFASSLEAKGQD